MRLIFQIKKINIFKKLSWLIVLLMVVFNYSAHAQKYINYNTIESNKTLSYFQLNSEHNKRLSEQYKLDYNLPENFPSIIVTNKNQPSDGIYFLYSRLSDGNFMICVDTSGTPVFFREMAGIGGDFRLHTNGYLVQFEEERSCFVQYDSSYNEMRTYAAGEGLLTDSHDLLIEDDGSYWIIGKQIHIIDMSVIVPGGNSSAYVIENVIQHIDIPGNILFQWNSLDHIDILDSDTLFVNLTGPYIDYIHINALDLDTDGNLLISSRHLNEITKIDVSTGDIIWRWGGNQNQFTFINDDKGFSGQHSIRSQGDAIYTIFDNGNWHSPQHSRGLEYQLDETLMTASLDSEYVAGDSLSYSSSMGHMQRTYDQGTILGMAANNQSFILSEFNEMGEKVLDFMNFEGTLFSYRAFKNNWETNKFFFTKDTIEINYEDNGDTTAIATLYNNSDETIEMTGFHTNNNAFSIIDIFPLSIPPNSEWDFTIAYSPTTGFYHTDALTIYSDSNSDSLRIASQIRVIANLITVMDQKDIEPVGLKIRPNPIDTYTRISISNNRNIERIRLIDINGRVVREINNIQQKSIILEKAGLSYGIFIVEVHSENKVLFDKLIIN